MKFAVVALPLLTIALAACGDTASEPKTMEEVAEEASGMVKPLAGQYESTTKLVKFDMPGQPPEVRDQLQSMMGSQFEQTTSTCITQEQADQGFEEKFRNFGEGANGLKCDFTNFDVNGSTVDAALSCSGPSNTTATINMDGQVTEDTQKIDMEMNLTAPGMGGMELAMEVESKRTGDCS